MGLMGFRNRRPSGPSLGALLSARMLPADLYVRKPGIPCNCVPEILNEVYKKGCCKEIPSKDDADLWT